MRGSQSLLSVGVAVLLLAAADRLLQPVPVPAGTAVLGGLLGSWLGRELSWLRVCAGFIVGLLLGIGAHGYIHLTGRSTPPQEGLGAHLALDGAVGLAVAILAVGAGVLLRKSLEQGVS